jgi:hypothetical protein
MRTMKAVRTVKAVVLASVLAAVSLTSGVEESFAGVPTAAAIAPAVTASGQFSPAEQVYWHGGWHGGGWHGGGWHGGWHRGWGYRRPGWGWGGPVVYGGCWRWRGTPWGPRRVWVC